MNRKTNTKILSVMAGFVIALTAGAHSDAFKPAFVDTLVGPYLEVQDSLAGDNLDKAKSGAKAFVEAMKNAPEAAPSEEINELVNPAKKIAGTSEIASARKAFEDLSIQLVSLVNHIGTSSDKPLYLAYCPMAFGGAGASWIQEDKTIANPYYGASMLRCGSINTQFAGKKQSDAHEKAESGHEHTGHGHGMVDKPEDPYRLANLDAIHAGVPGYHAGKMPAKPETASADDCGMSCCSDKGGI